MPRHFPVAVSSAFVALALSAGSASGQSDTAPRLDPSRPLDLSTTVALARRSSPAVQQARAAAARDAALARQASAYPNPKLDVQHERTSAGSTRNEQVIATFVQPIDLAARPARLRAAALRRGRSEASVSATLDSVAAEAAELFAAAVAADVRAALARDAAATVARARRIAAARLAAGDISGLEDRRMALEEARLVTQLGDATLERHRSRLRLFALIAPTLDARARDAFALDGQVAETPALALDTLVTRALAGRGDLRASRLAAEASVADARAAVLSRLPVPAVAAGIKREDAAGLGALRGVAVGITLPLPFWDRQGARVEATTAEAARAAAQARWLEAEVVRSVHEAAASLAAVTTQRDALRAAIGADGVRPGLAAAEAAYAEGELSLVEWLDAVEAFLDAARSLASLDQQYLRSRAALERAVGSSPWSTIR